MKKSTIAIFIIALLIIGVAIGTYLMVKKSQKTLVLLETNYGNITIELRNDQPITAGNFKNLVEKGTYNGVIFHRIIPNFMIQGGDPTGTGYGDPSIPNIQDEFNGDQFNERGTIAMANTGRPNSGSSQFFINLVYNSHLNGKHPVFGNVTHGMDVVDKIAEVPTNSQGRPVTPVVINKAIIV